MKDFYKKSENLEDSEKIGKAMIKLIEESLDLAKWNFALSYNDFNKISSQLVIYDSPSCRVSFSFSRQREPKFDELQIEYGRLHAPNDEPFMIWKGEECRCWHSILEPLSFLDNLSPQDASDQAKGQRSSQGFVENFKKSKTGIKLLSEYPPKYTLTLQSLIWKNYGQKLFDLFDLQHPELWEKYQKYLKEYYRLLGMKSYYGPPYENVC